MLGVHRRCRRVLEDRRHAEHQGGRQGQNDRLGVSQEVAVGVHLVSPLPQLPADPPATTSTEANEVLPGSGSFRVSSFGLHRVGRPSGLGEQLSSPHLTTVSPCAL